MKRKISQPLVRRLPRYYRYLEELAAEGLESISSRELAERMNVTASQIRQDFSCFGEFGTSGYGYNVEKLLEQMSLILGIPNVCGVIVVGVGNLGRAIIGKFDFAQNGFCLQAGFDVNPAVVGTEIQGVPILSMDELESHILRCKPEVAVLTLPKEEAQAALDRMAKLGIRGFWNFTNLELHVPEGVLIEGIHFADSLVTLGYRMRSDHAEEKQI